MITRISFSRFLINLTILLLYVIGGAITYFGIVNFRLMYVALPPYIFLLKYQKPFSVVEKTILGFIVIILLSKIINNSSWFETILFMRFVIIPYGIYLLIFYSFNRFSFLKIKKYLFAIGLIQLPIVIIQKLFATYLLKFTKILIHPIDLCSGTFYIKDDPSLAYFLLCLIVYLLYKGDAPFKLSKNIIILWLSATILISNSMLSHILLFIVLFVRVLNKRSLIELIRISLILTTTIFIVNQFNDFDEWKFRTEKIVKKLLMQVDVTSENENKFLSGKYSRSAAFKYYLSNRLKVFGDGPSAYYDPIKKVYSIGNKGQIFIFYSEIGIVGLIYSYVFMYILARNKRQREKDIRFYWIFILFVAFSLTSSVLSDSSMVFSFLIYNKLINSDGGDA